MSIFRTISLLFCGVAFVQSAINKAPIKSDINSTQLDNDSIYATYQYVSSTGFFSTTISLKRNYIYSYSSGTDIGEYVSSGQWEKVKDTFVLTSFLKKNDLPMTLKESIEESSDSFNINWVRNLNGDVMKDAIAVLNDEEQDTCMPIFDECKFKKGAVKRIKFKFINNMSTQWYALKNNKSTKVEPVLDVNFRLDNYVFFDKKKYLKVKNRLYELKEINPVGEVIDRQNSVDTSYFLKRIK